MATKTSMPKLITKRMEQLELFKNELPSAVDDAAAVMSQQLELLNSEYQIRCSEDLRIREDAPLTWKEVVKDPESAFTLGCIVVVVLLMIFW